MSSDFEVIVLTSKYMQVLVENRKSKMATRIFGILPKTELLLEIYELINMDVKSQLNWVRNEVRTNYFHFSSKITKTCIKVTFFCRSTLISIGMMV